MNITKDKCNREIKHIRFSITSRCNYNCLHCDKEGFIPKEKELTVDEITRLCEALAKILNVKRIKFTGGEPLYREEIIQIIQRVYDLRLYEDISLTTNGLLLYELAIALKHAGLNRINISLCSLNNKTYKKITGSDTLSKVLKGIDRAKEVGLKPIKINYVMLRGINENDIEEVLEYCAKNDFILQLIELHKYSDGVNKSNEFYKNHYVNIQEFMENLKNKVAKTETREFMQKRKIYTLINGAQIETVHPNHDFCMGCTKLRVSSDGKLFGCLYKSDLGENIKSALLDSVSLSKYEEIITRVVKSREPYY